MPGQDEEHELRLVVADRVEVSEDVVLLELRDLNDGELPAWAPGAHIDLRLSETIVRVPHPKLGSVLMQNVIPRLSDTPGRIRHPGPEIGEHNEDVYCGELGLSGAELEELRKAGVI